MIVRISYLQLPNEEYEKYGSHDRVPPFRLDFGIPIPRGTSASDYEAIELDGMKCRVYGYNWTRSSYEKPPPQMLSFAIYGILNYIG